MRFTTRLLGLFSIVVGLILTAGCVGSDPEHPTFSPVHDLLPDHMQRQDYQREQFEMMQRH